MSYNNPLPQGAHRTGISGKSGNFVKKISRSGKIREFDFFRNIREISGNFSSTHTENVIVLYYSQIIYKMNSCLIWTCLKYFQEKNITFQNQFCYPSALWAGGVLSSRFGRAGGCQTCGTHISVTAGQIFSIRSSVELSWPVVVQCSAMSWSFVHLPHMGLPMGQKLVKFCHKLGPDFVEPISLKLLDGFTPFKVSWTCLDL